MKLLFLSLLAALMLSGCGNISSDRIIREAHCEALEDRKAVAEFILACSAAANPMSDEEGEDLVAQCQLTGQAVLCPEHIHRKTFRQGNWSFVEYEEPTDNVPVSQE